MKRLFISDLDGTLLNSKCKLTEFSKNSINELIENGLNFTIATARSLNSAAPILEGLNLKLPMVLYNGVLVYDPVSKTNLQENFISTSNTALILEEMEAQNVEPIVFSLSDQYGASAYYRNKQNTHMATYINTRLSQNDQRFKQIKTFEGISNENILTVICIGNARELESLKHQIELKVDVEIHFAKDVYYPDAHWLEFTAKNSTKKSGVQFLKQHLKAEKTIVFGDNLNDIPMFEVADEKYATENGREELKAVATAVIDKNDNDAVANFLLQWNTNKLTNT